MSTEEDVGTAEASGSHVARRGVGAGVKVPLLIIATIAFLGAMDYAKSLMLPVVLAFVLSLTLTPREVSRWTAAPVTGPFS